MRILRAACLGCLLAPILQTADAAGVAMITEMGGGVTVQARNAQAWTPATTMKLLMPGDRVQTSKEGRATLVFFSRGTRERVEPESRALIQAGGCKVESGPKPTELPRISLQAAQRLANLRVGTGRAGSVLLRRRPDEQRLEPRALYHTQCLAPRPTFAWFTDEQADRFVLSVYDEDDVLVWSGETTSCELTYPDTAPALTPRTEYLWEVKLLRSGRRTVTLVGIFSILDEDTAATVRAQARELCPEVEAETDVTTLVLLAALYSEHNLWDDALRAYQMLAHRLPQDAEVSRRLQLLQSEQGQGAP